MPIKTTATSAKFPCPICGMALDVRASKKDKPYMVCDPCGVQLFVRGSHGIERLKQLVVRGEAGNALERLAEIERRYRKSCPKCRKSFWIIPELMKTSWFNGELTGYQCPTKDCEGVIALDGEK